MRLRLAFFSLVLLLGACGGGSGNGANSGAMGSVTLSLSDGLIDGYDQVLMEIAEIRLLGSGGQDILVLEQPVTVDFLALQNFSEVLLRHDVVSGTYSKIRLIVNSVKLIKLDGAGNVATEDDVTLSGNGKIDINPQGPFTVHGGEDIVVNLDVDLDKSIHVVGSGNGKFHFRPVVLASIATEPAFNKLFRVDGTVDMIDANAHTFTLCDIRRASTTGSQGPNPADVCVKIDGSGTPPYFNQDAQPIDTGFGGLALNDHVTLYGKFDASGTPDLLVPAVVATGSGFENPRGVAASEYRPATHDFDLGGATDQCVVDPNPLRIEVAPGAPAFSENSTGATPVDLTATPLLCLRAEAEGFRDTTADPFLRAFIVLLGEAVTGRLELVGTLTDRGSTSETDDFDLALTAGGSEVIVVNDATRYVKITKDAQGEITAVEELTAAPTSVEVTVFGVRRTDGSNIVDASFVLEEVSA